MRKREREWCERVGGTRDGVKGVISGAVHVRDVVSVYLKEENVGVEGGNWFEDWSEK